jgi:Zn-dependent peptidase ImmA (M78 family)
MQDIFIYNIAMPSKIEGLTLYRDNDYIVLVNNQLSQETQNRAIQHEISHINENHIYDCRNVGICEMEVEIRKRG